MWQLSFLHSPGFCSSSWNSRACNNGRSEGPLTVASGPWRDSVTFCVHEAVCTFSVPSIRPTNSLHPHTIHTCMKLKRTRILTASLALAMVPVLGGTFITPLHAVTTAEAAAPAAVYGLAARLPKDT